MNVSKVKTDLFKSKFIPAKVKSNKLMLVLHGQGDSIRPFSTFQDEIEMPEMNMLLLNAPNKYFDGWSWYNDKTEKQEVLQLRGKIFELLADLEAQGWKSEDIFIFGFSQGCMISADVAMNYPKKLGGVLGISGYFHFFPRWRQKLTTAARKTPWFFTHGYEDEVLDIDETKFGVQKLKDAGLNVTWNEMSKTHVMADDEYPMIRDWVRKKMGSRKLQS